MVSLNFTVVVFVLSFLAYVALLKLLFFDRIGGLIKKREAFVFENIASSKSIQASVEDKIQTKNPQGILAKAREEAAVVLNEIVEKSQASRSALVEENKVKLRSEIETNLAKLASDSEAVLASSGAVIKELGALAIFKMLQELGSTSKETVSI